MQEEEEEQSWIFLEFVEKIAFFRSHKNMSHIYKFHPAILFCFVTAVSTGTMTSSYPPQRKDTAIQLLSYYEKYLIQQQEQDPSSLKVKIKEGDTQHYLTDRDWDNVLNEADCRCIICTEQILQAHKVIHSACACKPYPVIHASCMLELQQRGEREVNGKENNTPANNEKKKQSFYYTFSSVPGATLHTSAKKVLTGTKKVLQFYEHMNQKGRMMLLLRDLKHFSVVKYCLAVLSESKMF